jgi:hypothetical protein
MFCVRAAEEGKPGEKQPELAADAGQDTIARLDKLRHSQGSLSVAQIRSNLQKTMQADAAVFRTQVMFTHNSMMPACRSTAGLSLLLGNPFLSELGGPSWEAPGSANVAPIQQSFRGWLPCMWHPCFRRGSFPSSSIF